MEIKIRIRNSITGERTILKAYTREMAKRMISQAINDGWYVTIDKNTEEIIKELQRENLENCKK